MEQQNNMHVVHIGGRRGLGPASRLCRTMKGYVDITILEAFLEEDEEEIFPETKEKGNYRFIKACVWSKKENRNFYVTQQVMASSLFPMDKVSDGYVFESKGTCQKWKDHCTTKKILTIETIAFDDICFHSSPNFLSMDIQGAEFEVMKGALQSLSGPMVGLIAEFEIASLYEGQGLLEDQLKFLREHGFVFVDIIKPSIWHYGEIQGKGMLIGGEALWFRSIDSIESTIQDKKDKCLTLLKLALTASVYKHISYAFSVVEHMILEMPDELRYWYEKFSPAQSIVDRYNKHSSRSVKFI